MIVDARHVFTRHWVRMDPERGTATVVPGTREGNTAAPAEWLFCPPLIDLQVNGAFGVDLQDLSLTESDFLALCRGLAREGVVAWLPTLITDAVDRLARKVALLGGYIRKWPAYSASEAGACPLGIHLEGPFISSEDGARGAHPREYVQPASVDIFSRIMDAAGGAIRYVTLAPEVPGGLELIAWLRHRNPGLLIGIGHTLADGSIIREAVRVGARICTHLGNGLPARIHRHQNPVWPQLAEEGLYASFIPDLHHLPADTLMAMMRAKGPERTLFVSDAVSLAGQPPGTYEQFGTMVEKRGDGRICLAGTELLAGSGTLLLEGLLRAVGAGSFSIEAAWQGGFGVPAGLMNSESHGMPFSTDGTIRNGILLRRAYGENGAVQYLPEAGWIRGCRVR